jgi:hypothetical protein
VFLDNYIIETPWSYRPGDEYLITILKSPVVLAFSNRLPQDQLEFQGEIYEDLGLGDWNGFYNFLRISRDLVIGLEFQPHDRGFSSKFKECVLGNPQVKWDGPFLQIFFGKRTDFDPHWTSMGNFGWDFFFMSQSNSITITFWLRGLSDEGRQNLASSRDWNL